MNDIELLSSARRVALADLDDAGAPKPFVQPRAGGAPAPGAPDGDETLAWLGGSRLEERVRKGLMRPRGRADRQEADRLLSQPPPTNPIDAARRRATTLPQLKKLAPEDPRVEALFAADPVLAEDPDSSALVTQAMFNARIALFDATLALIGRPPLSHDQKAELMHTLAEAYPHLSDAAKVEWTLSEMRLEECRVFTESRTPRDLDRLGTLLRETLRDSGLWTAARMLSLAAHTGLGRSRSAAPLASLLEFSAHTVRAMEAEQARSHALPEGRPREN